MSLLVYRRAVTPRGFLLLLSLVVVALWLLRTFLHDGPSNADVYEQIGFLDSWRLGYGAGANPPLFTWLAKAVFAVMPAPYLAVEFVRFALLWLFCVFLWLAVRAVTGEEDLGVMAGLAPFAVYMVGWEAVFRHSNTMTLIMSVGLSFLALVQLDRRGETRDYLLFGVATAIGLLSKYNYPVFWLALVGAALADPTLRGRILDRRFLLSLGVALLLVTPFVWWLAGNIDAAVTHGRRRAYGAVDLSGWLIARETLAGFAGAVLGLVLPLVIVIAMLAPRSFVSVPAAPEPIRRYMRFLTIHLALLGALMLGSMAVLSVTDFPERYIYIGLLVVPWLILRVAATVPSRHRRAQLVTILVVFMLVVIAGTALRYAVYPYYAKNRLPRPALEHSLTHMVAAVSLPPMIAVTPSTTRSRHPGS